MSDHPMNIVITMGGEGQRFRDAGYREPKFMVATRGRSLFAWSMLSLAGFTAAGARFLFVAQRAHGCGNFIARECTGLGIGDWELLEIDGVTDGQARTVLHAAPAIGDVSRPFLVFNIDTYVEPVALPADAPRGDGWIPCFAGAGEAWSFARVGHDGRVAELREKQRISPHATVGLYWFSSFSLYRDAFRRYYADGRNSANGELYVAPLYNQLIADGRDVFISDIPVELVHPLGTPDDVEHFAVAA